MCCEQTDGAPLTSSERTPPSATAIFFHSASVEVRTDTGTIEIQRIILCEKIILQNRFFLYFLSLEIECSGPFVRPELLMGFH